MRLKGWRLPHLITWPERWGCKGRYKKEYIRTQMAAQDTQSLGVWRDCLTLLRLELLRAVPKSGKSFMPIRTPHMTWLDSVHFNVIFFCVYVCVFVCFLACLLNFIVWLFGSIKSHLSQNSQKSIYSQVSWNMNVQPLPYKIWSCPDLLVNNGLRKQYVRTQAQDKHHIFWPTLFYFTKNLVQSEYRFIKWQGRELCREEHLAMSSMKPLIWQIEAFNFLFVWFIDWLIFTY